MKAISLSLLAALFLYGCSSDESSRQAPMAGDATGSNNDVIGPADVATDPVSYSQVRTDSAWNTYWNGRWYYFESRENQRKFESSPTSYVREDGRVQQERYKVRPHDVR